MNLELYERKTGPLCVVGKVFIEQPTTKIVTQLFSCGLRWYWLSSREGAALPGQPPLPEVRHLSELTTDNSHDFELDLEEVTGEGYEYRHVALFGMKGRLNSPRESDLTQAMKEFFLEKGPIRIVIHRHYDVRIERIFMVHEPGPEVLALSRGWHIELDAIKKRRPYDKLRLARLEDVYDAITKNKLVALSESTWKPLPD